MSQRLWLIIYESFYGPLHWSFNKPVLKVWTHCHHNVISLKMFSLIFSSCLESSDDVINIVIIQPWIIHDWIISFTNPIVTKAIWWIISMFIQTSKKWSRIKASLFWLSEWCKLDSAMICIILWECLKLSENRPESTLCQINSMERFACRLFLSW